MAKVFNELYKNITLLDTPTSYALIKDGHGDAFCLYAFYCYMASWQGTDKVKAVNSFCMQALGWGKTRFLNAKRILKNKKLIKKIIRRDPKSKKIIGNYVQIQLTRGSKNRRAVLGTTNAFPIHTGTNANSVPKAKTKIPLGPLYPVGFPMFLTMPEEDMPQTADEAREMVAKWKREPVTGDAKKSLSPCTIDEILHLCKVKRLYYNDVIGKYHTIVEMINDGSFQARYPHHKTLYNTLSRWLQMDIDRGYLQPMSDPAEYGGFFNDKDGYLLPERYKERKMWQELKERKQGGEK